MDKKALTNIHLALCQELGIEPATIYFVKPFSKFFGANYYTEDHVIEIATNLSEVRTKQLIAHETWHHYQTCRGWLDDFGYKGVDREEYPEYWSRPWEIGARRYERKIAKREGWYETKSKQKA